MILFMINGKRQVLSLLICLLCAQLASIATAQTPESFETSAPKSQIGLEEDYKVKLRDMRILRWEIDVLQNVILRIPIAKKHVQGLTLDKANASHLLDNAMSAFKRIKDMPASKKLSDQSTEFQGFRDIMYDLGNNLSSPREVAYQLSEGLPRGEDEREIHRIILGNIQKVMYPQEREDSIPIQENLWEVFNGMLKRIPYRAEDAIEVKEFKNEIEKLDKLLSSIQISNLEETFNRSKEIGQKILDTIKARLDTELGGRKDRLSTVEKEVSNLDELLAEKKEKKTTIDQGLIYAIYLMIVALIFLFFLIRIFPLPVAIAIINKRALVEVLSMAFMLITVIILGTGEKIGRETLGTLLGTIAGYIFGRRLTLDQDNEQRQNNELEQDKKPKQDKKAE